MTRDNWTDDRIDRLADVVENIAKGQGMLIQSVERITETQGKLADAHALLTQHQPEVTTAQAEIAHSVAQLTRTVLQLRDMVVSTNAAVERLDQLMDYLLQRDLERDSAVEPQEPAQRPDESNTSDD